MDGVFPCWMLWPLVRHGSLGSGLAHVGREIMDPLWIWLALPRTVATCGAGSFVDCAGMMFRCLLGGTVLCGLGCPVGGCTVQLPRERQRPLWTGLAPVG